MRRKPRSRPRQAASSSGNGTLGQRSVSWPTFAFACGATLFLANLWADDVAPVAQVVVEQPLTDAARSTLAWTFAKLIEDAVPPHYDKQKDWGRTKNITVGLEFEDGKFERRKKPVNHGVWKHYKAWLVDPEHNLSVRIENLRSLKGNRVGFTLLVSAKLDLWARAKVYEYGVHLIALEAAGQTAFEVALDCEVGVQLKIVGDESRAVIDPRVIDARLTLREFRLDRVSNAHGPLVEELGEEVKKLVEEELHGPELTAKLNRAIDKKRGKLEFTLPALFNSSWWPLAELTDVDDPADQRPVLTR